jgi:hypothetical protein
MGGPYDYPGGRATRANKLRTEVACHGPPRGGGRHGGQQGGRAMKVQSSMKILALAPPGLGERRHRGLALRDVRSILDANYLHRDPALAESAIRKLEQVTS